MLCPNNLASKVMTISGFPDVNRGALEHMVGSQLKHDIYVMSMPHRD